MGGHKIPNGLQFLANMFRPNLKLSEEAHRARIRLMESAQRVFPKLLDTLSSEVFPLYSQLGRQGVLSKDGCDFPRALRLWPIDPSSPLDTLTDSGGLKTAFSRWAARFNVTADWMVVGAFRTLHLWNRAPDLLESRRWDTLQVSHRRIEKSEICGLFKFEYQRWDVTIQTWPVYGKALQRSFAEAPAAYERSSRQIAESHGLVRARRQHSPSNLEWFVLYQFAGLSSVQIAVKAVRKDEAPDASTVLKGVRAAQQLLGWKRLRLVHRDSTRNSIGDQLS